MHGLFFALVALTTASAPPEATAQKRVIVLSLDRVGAPESTAVLVDGLLAEALSQDPRLDVTTQKDIAVAVDLESEKAALGCDTSTCLAEIAGAMGARYVVYGNIGVLGATTLVQLNLFDAEAARPISREKVSVQDAEALLTELEPAVARLIAPLFASDAPPAAATAVDDVDAGGSVLPLGLVGGGAAVAVTGGISALALGVTALVINEALGQPAQTVDAGTKQTLLYVGLPALGASVVAALAMGLGVAVGVGGGIWWAVE